MKRALRVFVSALLVCAFGLAAAGQYPPGPAFDSEQVEVPDQGTVMPVPNKSGQKYRIAVIGLENNPFWVPVREGSLEAKKILAPFDCTVDWIVPPGEQHTADFFGTTIEAAMVQQYDAIATVAGDSGIVPYINGAVEAGIPVATFNVETTEPNERLFFVGADLYLQGRVAGETMAKLLNGKGKVAVQTGFFSVEGLEQRRLGFEESLKEFGPDIEIVGRVENLERNDIAYSQTKDFLTAHPDLGGVFSAASGAAGTARALEEAGLPPGKVKIVCYDFYDEVMEHVATGGITCTIGQEPISQGRDPAIRLYNYMEGGVVPPAARLFTKMPVVTKENYREYWTPPGE